MVASAALGRHSKSRLRRRFHCSQLIERSTTQRVGAGAKAAVPLSPGAVSSRQPQWAWVQSAKGRPS